MAQFVRKGRGHARKAGRGAPPFLGNAPHKEAARALLHGRALDGVDPQVEAKVGEAGQRNALLGVLVGVGVGVGVWRLKWVCKRSSVRSYLVKRRRRPRRRRRRRRARGVTEQKRRWQRRRRRARSHARVDVPEGAIDKDELWAALEHALDDGAARCAPFTPGRI